jgi:hypothetical protein
MTSREPIEESDDVLAPATPGAQALPATAAEDDESPESLAKKDE